MHANLHQSRGRAAVYAWQGTRLPPRHSLKKVMPNMTAATSSQQADSQRMRQSRTTPAEGNNRAARPVVTEPVLRRFFLFFCRGTQTVQHTWQASGRRAPVLP